MIAPHIIHMLGNDAPTTALVPSTAIFLKKIPQNTTATNANVIIVRQRSGGSVKSIQGRTGDGTAFIEVIAYADDGETAELIQLRVSNALDCYKGTVTIPSATGSGNDTVTFRGIFKQDEDDEDWLADVHSSEVGRHMAGSVFKCWYTEQTI